MVRLILTYWPYKYITARTKLTNPHRKMTAAATLLQNATAAAAAVAVAARDSVKTAEVHQRFTQDIRRQIEAEYNAAADEEIAACGDLDRKRRHADELEESHKRLRSDAFRSLVKVMGGQTCVPFSISGAAYELEVAALHFLNKYAAVSSAATVSSAASVSSGHCH